MERYRHLQNLPNSPLTPLTPLCENTSFEFNFGGDGSLDVYIDNIRHKHRMEKQQRAMMTSTRNDLQVEPRRFSERFSKLRDVFERHGGENCSPYQKQETTMQVPQRVLHLKDPPKKLLSNALHKESQVTPQQQLVHDKNCQFLKQQQQHNHHHHHTVSQPQKATVTPQAGVKITHTGATPSEILNDYVTTPKNIRTGDISSEFPNDFVSTPKNIGTPLKQRNSYVALNHSQKQNQMQHMLKQKQQQYREFLRAHLGSPSRNRTTILTQQFLQASPVALKPLCPRVSKMLNNCGLSIYCGLFQREEIDLFSFKLLERRDLLQMGVSNSKHCDMILSEVSYARKYL